MSSDFDFFKKIEQYITDESVKYECEHLDIKEENDVCICIDCGEELKRNFNFEKEWRYYGSDDNRRNTDPNRCQLRKSDDKNIFSDVEKLGLEHGIITVADDIYTQVTKGKIYRGKSRKAIIFACIFQSFKVTGKPQSCEKLKTIFDIEKKVLLKGIKHVTLNLPKDFAAKTRYITPLELIEEFMNKFDASVEQKGQVVDLYQRVKNKSSILNRARPQSFASGLIYYWMLYNDNSGIQTQEFIQKINLSKLTINKIAREINKILNP